MRKNSTKNITSSITKDAKKKKPEVKKKRGQSSELPLWVRVLEVIAPCLTLIGQGLCWIFGSFLILAVLIFVITGAIAPDALLEFAKNFLPK